MKVLVTGATGHTVGSIAEKLMASSSRVDAAAFAAQVRTSQEYLLGDLKSFY